VILWYDIYFNQPESNKRCAFPSLYSFRTCLWKSTSFAGWSLIKNNIISLRYIGGQEVSAEFHKTCPNKIIKIERVQNSTLYGAYALNKQRMDKAGGRGSNEMSLFHGTKGDKCKLIHDKGFNCSFCGDNGRYTLSGFPFSLLSNSSGELTLLKNRVAP